MVLLNCCNIGFGQTFEGLDKTKSSKLITSIVNNGNSISFEALKIVFTQISIPQFGLSLQQIMDVDEKDQIMMTNVWLNLVKRNVSNDLKFLNIS